MILFVRLTLILKELLRDKLTKSNCSVIFIKYKCYGGIIIMENNQPSTRERYEDEIDLVELIKILLKNIKFITITTILITLIGLAVGFYLKSTESVTLEQNFSLNDYSEVGMRNLNPADMFKNNQVVEEFFQEKIIKDMGNQGEKISEKRKLLENLYTLSNLERNKPEYRISVSSETEEKATELIRIFFKNLNLFVENQRKTELKDKILLVDNKLNEYELELKKLEREIDQISKTYANLIGNNTSVSDIVEAIKEKSPITFTKKDTYATMYDEALREKLKIERIIVSLNNKINVRSSIYEVEGKIKLSLVGIISVMLGGFLAVIIVFLKEFIKKVDWK